MSHETLEILIVSNGSYFGWAKQFIGLWNHIKTTTHVYHPVKKSQKKITAMKNLIKIDFHTKLTQNAVWKCEDRMGVCKKKNTMYYAWFWYIRAYVFLIFENCFFACCIVTSPNLSVGQHCVLNDTDQKFDLIGQLEVILWVEMAICFGYVFDYVNINIVEVFLINSLK